MLENYHKAGKQFKDTMPQCLCGTEAREMVWRWGGLNVNLQRLLLYVEEKVGGTSMHKLQ